MVNIVLIKIVVITAFKLQMEPCTSVEMLFNDTAVGSKNVICPYVSNTYHMLFGTSPISENEACCGEVIVARVAFPA
jgi:hypothetical protein